MKPTCKSLLVTAFAAIIFHSTLISQVVVNEFCAANYSDWGLGGGWTQEYEDWVEFYNPTGAAINISGWFISDNASNPTKWEIPTGTSVPANGYTTVLLSGTGDYDPGYLGQLNTSFKVTQTAGEEIVFTNPAGVIVEQYDFDVISPNQANHSWARSTNGGADWRICTAPTPGAANSNATGTAYAIKPTMNQPAGYYAGSVSVTLTTTEPGASIRYTLDGSTPGTGSTLYTGPINIASTTVLRAIAISPTAGILPSFVETNTYFIGTDQHSIMIVSASGDEVGDGSWWGDEMMHIEFFAPDGTFLVEASGDSNEHGNDSNAYGQRGFDYVTRDALGYDNEVEYPIINTRDRDGYERIIFKAAANDNYPFSGGAHIRDAYVHQLSLVGELKLDERSTESCIVYLNGQYWGVYEAREKVDDIDFTDHYFDQPEGFVDFLKTWGGTWTEYGDGTDWYDLVDFITTNDMTNQANYDYVLTQYNHMSLIDYFILNTYVVTTDWLNWNTAWWRGRHPDGDAKRWRYALWDNDATFGHYINYTGVPSTQPDADPCQTDGMGDVGGQGHIPVLNALFDNEQFFADYIQRYASLSNSIFSCERMISVLDSMIDVIDPEMQRQCDRWGGTYSGWQNSVQELRDFILARCNDEVIGGLEDCYDVTALTLTVEIEGVGVIEIEQVPLSSTDEPYSGTFFADIPISLDAPGVGCGTFQGWEIVSGTGTFTTPGNPATDLVMETDMTIRAVFSAGTGVSEATFEVFPADAGIISLNGANIPSYPTSVTFDLETTQNLSVTANEWFEFDEWSSEEFDIESNNSDTEVTFLACPTGTITATFIELPHAELTVSVFPAGSGSVEMDGTALTPLPWTDVIAANVNYSFEAFEIPGVTVFSHWEINNNVITPDEFATLISLNLQNDDQLVAVFTVLASAQLSVTVEPQGAGTVEMMGMPLNLPFDEEILANVEYYFTTAPADEWSTFSHWTIGNHVLSPSATEDSIGFILTTDDELVAHYIVIPHAPITFMVNPPNAGKLTFSDEGSTTTETTKVLRTDYSHTVYTEADEDQFYRFSHWEIKNGNLINDSISPVNTANFIGTDTLIAHFSKEELSFYLPNSFTPNNDGVNDLFLPVIFAADPEKYELKIFNRWGQKVFETTDPTIGWEGDFNGGTYYAQDDIYIYQMKVKWFHAEEYEEKEGTIFVFR